MAYVSKGLAHYNLSQSEPAIRAYDKAAELNPQLPTAYINRGIAYSFVGLYERAMDDIDEAIRLDPEFADAYQLRALIYQALGHHQLYQRNLTIAWELRNTP